MLLMRSVQGVHKRIMLKPVVHARASVHWSVQRIHPPEIQLVLRVLPLDVLRATDLKSAPCPFSDRVVNSYLFSALLPDRSNSEAVVFKI